MICFIPVFKRISWFNDSNDNSKSKSLFVSVCGILLIPYFIYYLTRLSFSSHMTSCRLCAILSFSLSFAFCLWQVHWWDTAGLGARHKDRTYPQAILQLQSWNSTHTVGLILLKTQTCPKPKAVHPVVPYLYTIYYVTN